MTTQPLVVIPCGGRKAAHAAPAAELYTGSYFRAALAAARRVVGDDEIRILSGLHGLVRLDQVLEPYEQRIDKPGAITTERLIEQATEQGLTDAHRVTILAGKAYAARALAVWPHAEQPLKGARGMGDHLRVFAGYGYLAKVTL